MATNYTTKTAALRATKADMRQVAVSKKIEIGSGDTATKITDSEVSAEDLLVDVEGTRTSVKDLVSTSVGAAKDELTEAIGEVSDKVDNMKLGIDIGTDSSESPEDDPESGVTNAPAAFNAVSKLNFRGSYVTVVEDPVTKEVTLWINKSTAYPDYDTATPFDMDTTSKENNAVVTTQALSTSAVKLFTPPSDNNYTCTTGTNVNAVLVKDGANFGKTFYKLRTANGLETFRVSSTQALFIRTTYNGTAGEWKKIDFGTKAGRTHTIGQGYAEGVTASPFSGDSYATIGTTSDALYIRYSVQPFTSAQAPDGRVPNTSEAEVKMIVNWDALLTLDGGAATVEYAFAPNTTTDLTTLTPVKLVDKFFTEYKDATVTTITPSYVSKSWTDKISGLRYAKSGTTVKVNVTGINYTQWKASNQSDTRIVIDAADSSTDITAKVADCTLSKGSATGSDAVYDYTMPEGKTITAGSTNNNGNLKISVTPYSTKACTAKTEETTLKGFWGSVPTSDETHENFGVESGTGGYRMKTPTSTSVDFVSTEDVTTHSIDVNGTICCSAVCQYGKLHHPASAAPDGDGTTYSTSLPACFIRKFTGSKEPDTFTLKADNLIQSGKVQVWWKDGNSWYDLSTPKKGSVTHTGSNTIAKSILSSSGESQVKDMLIAIVVQPGATAIGPITATYA